MQWAPVTQAEGGGGGDTEWLIPMLVISARVVRLAATL